MSFNSSSYSNSIIKNNINNNMTSSISNNINPKKYLLSESSQILNFCNNISEINNQNENGYTPTYLSVLTNNIQALKELISLNANINITNNLNETPLFLSVNNNNLDAFLILMKYKADSNIQNIKGDTPLHIAVSKKEKKFIEILLSNNSNPNIQNFTQGQTPTHLAIINKLDEEILKMFKKYKADIFHIKDKLRKTPFDYAKEFNDENYQNLILKIFGYNHSTNNGLNEINNSIDEIKNNSIKKENTAINKYNKNIFNLLGNEKEVKEFSHSNRSSNNLNNEDYYIITTETNKNEFKIDNCDCNKDHVISNNSLRVNKIILSSDISSENVQIKELNSSIENNNLFKIKKSLTEFIPEEKYDKLDIKDNLEVNNNVLSQMYNQNGVTNKLPKTKSHRDFSRNSENIRTRSNMIFSNSNSSNNYSHKSNNSVNNSYNNLYMTNSVGANKKIIKNIIRDTIKKILVKSISSSEENNSNMNYLSKESEKIFPSNSNLEDTKKSNNTNPINNQNNINRIETKPNINNEKLFSEKNSYSSNEIKNTNNLYQNGTSYYFLNNNSVNEIIHNDNITVSKLIPKESETINLFDQLKNEPNKETNNIDIKNNVNLDIKENQLLENTDSNIFSDLQIKSNNNENISNNDISLSYSKNLQNEEDEIQYKLIENKLDKKLQEIKRENNLELNLDNSNLDIKIYDNQSNFDSKNNEILHIDSKVSQNNNSKSENSNIINDDIHNKKISNGNLINSNKNAQPIIDSYKTKEPKNKFKQRTLNYLTLDNYMDLSEDLNAVKNYSKKKIFMKNRLNHKSQIYLNRRKQLSYHLNINSKKMEKELNNEFMNDFYLTNVANTININENRENENPNRISLNNHKIYKNKNNIISGWYNINSNKSLKSSNKSKNSNKYLITNRGSKISLTKSGSCQNMNPPPIGGFMNKDICISPSNYSIASLNNINIQNSNSNNKKNERNKSAMNKALLNNTAFITTKPKHSSLKRIENNNNDINSNIKNIPIQYNNKININPYSEKNNAFKNENLINNNYDSEDSSNNINNKLKNISTEELIRLRDFLISCDLLCYYNLLITKNMYNIDSYIKDIQRKIIPLTYNDLEEIGIKKPGHIYRILIKLDIDAGIINNDLFSYIIDKINFNSVTSTLAMTSSVNGIFCCGINLCPNDNYNNKNRIRNNSIYFNDLSSFLRVNDIIRLKGNFIHNGFDRIEFIIIQQFSKYTFDKKILNEHLHIYIDRDKNKLLNILQMIKNNLSNEFGLNIGKSEETINQKSNEVIEFSNDKNINKKESLINNEINDEYNDNEEKSDNKTFCVIF